MTFQLSARDIRRSFRIGSRKVEVLRGINLDVLAGEALFLCGVSGAGKTTLLYTLAGLERPEAGEVVFEGHKLYSRGSAEDARIRNTRMGFIFQSYFLLPELTALENALLPSLIRHRQREDLAKEYLERVGLGDRTQHLPSELSGGEQQRVAIARALVNDPAIIFADEPTGNLDTANGDAIMNLLLELVRERQKTLIVVTHETRLAALGNRQVNMRDGLLVN
ncbi:MAG TPA: ABC transporter ATP-binding protein [Chthoniobacterales bacterium]|jgi:predicted ABC-type transport system involved in lysophospholipase L1 biosynthesis ATPase subunit|nr:ABC transporter ATP-binding protein [Chthoniobacterales bacterium]